MTELPEVTEVEQASRQLGLAAAAVCLALPVRAKQAPAAQQGGFISRKLNVPVPGGVAVLELVTDPLQITPDKRLQQ